MITTTLKPMEITTEQAVQHLQNVLATDPDYRYGWQANIAMAFYDECMKYLDMGYNLQKADIHKIANDAANRFLDVLLLNIDEKP